MTTTIRRRQEYPLGNIGIDGFLRLPRSFRTLVTSFISVPTQGIHRLPYSSCFGEKVTSTINPMEQHDRTISSCQLNTSAVALMLTLQLYHDVICVRPQTLLIFTGGFARYAFRAYPLERSNGGPCQVPPHQWLQHRVPLVLAALSAQARNSARS